MSWKPQTQPFQFRDKQRREQRSQKPQKKETAAHDAVLRPLQKTTTSSSPSSAGSAQARRRAAGSCNWGSKTARHWVCHRSRYLMVLDLSGHTRVSTRHHSPGKRRHHNRSHDSYEVPPDRQQRGHQLILQHSEPLGTQSWSKQRDSRSASKTPGRTVRDSTAPKQLLPRPKKLRARDSDISHGKWNSRPNLRLRRGQRDRETPTCVDVDRSTSQKLSWSSWRACGSAPNQSDRTSIQSHSLRNCLSRHSSSSAAAAADRGIPVAACRVWTGATW